MLTGNYRMQVFRGFASLVYGEKQASVLCNFYFSSKAISGRATINYFKAQEIVCGKSCIQIIIPNNQMVAFLKIETIMDSELKLGRLVYQQSLFLALFIR